jgi:hypothetical protein
MIVIFTLIIIIILLLWKKDIKENFSFIPWNMATRLYHSHDIRGYPATYSWDYPITFPWNYPFPGLPMFYLSPYYYKATGDYTYDKKYTEILNKKLKPIKSNKISKKT